MFFRSFWPNNVFRKKWKIRNRRSRVLTLQDRPKSAQDPPKTPPRPPRRAPGPLKRRPGPPRMPQEALPDPLGRPKTFSEASGPITFFGKIENSKSSKKSRKKSRQRSSTVVTRIGHHKNRKHFQNGRTQRVAAVVARSALQ